MRFNSPRRRKTDDHPGSEVVLYPSVTVLLLSRKLQQYLQMLVDHVSEWDREGAEKKNNTRSLVQP
jgi:hypothetical protein